MYKRSNFLQVVFVSVFMLILLLLPVAHIFGDDGELHNPAEGEVSNPSSFIDNPLKLGVDNVYALVELIVKDIIVPLGSAVVVIMIIYSGFLFVMAQGNETKIAGAKMTFFYSVIGAAILLGAWAIAEVIENTVDQVVG